MNKILIIISSLLISVQTYTYACDYISFPYPSCVAAKDKFDEVEYKKCLEVEKEVGITLTESRAMYPAASVSGWYFSHPNSVYFSVLNN